MIRPVTRLPDICLELLDEYLIRDLLYQGAKIDAFGVGERLITSKAVLSSTAFISFVRWKGRKIIRK